MNKKLQWISFGVLILGVLVVVILFPYREKIISIEGIVRDHSGSVLEDASVRVKATSILTQSDEKGRFILSGFRPKRRVHVTAWKDGFYVNGTVATARDTIIHIELVPYDTEDNENYNWIQPSVVDRHPLEDFVMQSGLSISDRISVKTLFFPFSKKMKLGCRDCHSRPIYEQWNTSAHALGFDNIIFKTMYNGSDAWGNLSPETRMAQHRDYGTIPLRPQADKKYFGPGYKLDFPRTNGNCAACHLPGAAIDDPYGIDPNQVSGTNRRGTHCDYCHKIKDVKLDPSSGIPFENMPGVLSTELIRPGSGNQIFFGPYDDVDAGPDTYLPLIQQSEICAPCHSASFWGTPIYQSFPEWLASPYPARGETCQSCHMKPDGTCTNFARHRGGIDRNPSSIPTHDFPGGGDTTLLRNAVTMTVTSKETSENIIVQVVISNDKTGHHVPTGSPLRHLILFVRLYDGSGQLIKPAEGPLLPEWCGVGDPDKGYYGGFPGKVFAKTLDDMWTGIYPTAAYWNHTRLISDTRIAAFDRDTSFYTFPTNGRQGLVLDVKLLYRRAYIELRDQKGWQIPDITMASKRIFIEDEKILQ